MRRVAGRARESHVSRSDIPLLPLRERSPAATAEASPSLASRFVSNKWSIRAGYSLNAFYTVFVSLLFAAFSYRRAQGDVALGAFYAVSSIIMNAPMAWFFTENTIDVGKRLYKKREKLFITAFCFAFVLATGTTAAGLKVAAESVQGAQEIPLFGKLITPGMSEVLIFMSAFNTFSTRFVGSIHLIHSVMLGVRNFYRSSLARFSPYYQFQNDLKRYAHLVNVTYVYDKKKTDNENLEIYAKAFYSQMESLGIRPGRTWSHVIKESTQFTVSLAIISIFIVNMMPLWIKLTVGGTETFSEKLSQSPGVVFLAALSNELFYLNSGRQFISRSIEFSERGYAKTKRKLQGSSNWITGLTAVSAVIGLLAWSTFAYYSGTGYGEDGLEAMQEGFGPMANSIWMSWMGWWTDLFMPVYSKVITTGAAGIVVNGGASLSFALARIPFFKADVENEHQMTPNRASSKLDTYVQSGADDDSARLRDAVEMGRHKADPRPTLWQQARGVEVTTDCCSGRQAYRSLSS